MNLDKILTDLDTGKYLFKNGVESAKEDILKLIDLKYDSKLSRKYLSTNITPSIAHRNGYRLAVRDIKRRLNV